MLEIDVNFFLNIPKENVFLRVISRQNFRWVSEKKMKWISYESLIIFFSRPTWHNRPIRLRITSCTRPEQDENSRSPFCFGWREKKSYFTKKRLRSKKIKSHRGGREGTFSSTLLFACVYVCVVNRYDVSTGWPLRKCGQREQTQIFVQSSR